jgi:hypothetical protein
MHELPAAAWMLIAFSTVPWLLMTAIHYFRHSRREPASAAQKTKADA